MLKNLKIEWMKIKNYRVFQVFSVLYLIAILLMIYVFHLMYTNIMDRITGGRRAGNDGNDFLNLFTNENIWDTVAFSTSFLLYLPGMVIINLFINEVNFKTHRQNIIDGWKRETFIYTKIGLITAISLTVTIMNLLATVMMFVVLGKPVNFEGAATLGICFLQSFIYLMFALTLATFFRRSGIAIIVFFIYGLLLELLFMWIFWKIIPGLQHFLPLQVADSLIPIGNADGSIFGDYPGLPVMIIAALAFAGLYIYLAVRKYKHDDL
jgi:ABC-2 type transport system permease protein